VKKWIVVHITSESDDEIITARKCCFNAGWVIFYGDPGDNDMVVAAFPAWQVTEVKLIV
jgi:hypothetical protein